MPETPEPKKEVDSQLKPRMKLSPKRGAFPTPRAEIDKAKQYVPDADQDVDKSGTEPVCPDNVDDEEDKSSGA
jgi:hypothetical protein